MIGDKNTICIYALHSIVDIMQAMDACDSCQIKMAGERKVPIWHPMSQSNIDQVSQSVQTS